jgi:hypothetical protein
MITFGRIYILILHIRCVQIILKIKYKISQFSPCGFTLSKIHWVLKSDKFDPHVFHFYQNGHSVNIYIHLNN